MTYLFEKCTECGSAPDFFWKGNLIGGHDLTLACMRCQEAKEGLKRVEPEVYRLAMDACLTAASWNFRHGHPVEFEDVEVFGEFAEFLKEYEKAN